jgi:glycosyltransferase involved in cell wall biosynthesis
MQELIVASVIVPTYNRVEMIMRVMTGLESQLTHSIELIVVIDGSKDDSFQRISERKWNIENLTVINQENKGRAGARNAGVAQAKGSILIFIDDDIIVTENFLNKHISAQKDQDIIVGKLIPEDVHGNREMYLFSEYLNEKWTDDLDVSEKPPYISAQNFSIKKSLFNQFNGFDERLRDSEDLDLAFRLHNAGYEIFHSKEVIAKVPLNASFKETFLRVREYKKGREELAKTDSLAGKVLGETKDKVHPFKKIIFFFFSFPFWYKLVDMNFFIFLPQKVRFKLYDWMMTANMIY